MRNQLDLKRTQARAKVKAASNFQLNEESWLNQLMSESTIICPKFIHESKKVAELKELPPGIPSTLSKGMAAPATHSIIYEVPIEGDENIFQDLLSQNNIDGKCAFNKSTFYYRELVSHIDLPQIKQAVKNNLTEKINSIETVLNNYQANYLDNVNKELATYIKREIIAEKEKRKKNDDNRNDLNTF